MDFYYTLSDPLLFAVIGLGSVLFGIFLAQIATYLRRIIPKNVKCWFCHHETAISFKISNSWVCTNCEQYNGFKKDGDYNRVIPNQHEAKLNSNGFTYEFNQNSMQIKNKLCEKCNLKQQLKIQQLAEFVPMNEKNYDNEIEHFQRQIDKGLEICNECDSLLVKVLHTLREDLSLPKKLSAAVSKINIRGEGVIFINVLLSLLLAFSSLKFELSLPLKLKEDINQSLYNNEIIRDYLATVSNHSLTSVMLTNTLQVLIGTGIFTNLLGFYQTNSPAVFFNIVSWILMLLLTLNPSGYEDVIDILKVLSGGASMAIGIIFLLKNYYRRNVKKSTLWEKKNAYKTSSTSIAPLKARSQSVSNMTTVLGGENICSKDENFPGISSGMSSLSLGMKLRSDLARPPLVNPARFNPFTRTSTSERSYVTSLPTSGNSYDPCHSRTSPSERSYHTIPQTPEKGYNPSQSQMPPSERSYLTRATGKGYDSGHSRTSPSERSYHTSLQTSGKGYDAGQFRTSPSERSYLNNLSWKGYDPRTPLDKSFYSKPSIGDMGKYYDTSLNAPSVYDSFEQLPPYTYSQPCYPCTPTLAYYFSTQCPKTSPPSPYLLSSTPNFTYLNKNETTTQWKFFSFIGISLVVCNIILMGILYVRGV